MTERVGFTLAEFVADRRSQDRAVSVFVKGGSGQNPPGEIATVCRVANVLQSEEGSVVDVNEGGVEPDSIARGSVVLFTVPEDGGDEAWEELRHIGSVVASRSVHMVVYADELPEYVLRYVDIRVVDNGGVESVGRLQVDPYGGEVYEVEMGGLS